MGGGKIDIQAAKYNENNEKEIMMKKLSVAIVVVMAFMGVLFIGCNTKQAEQKPAEQKQVEQKHRQEKIKVERQDIA